MFCELVDNALLSRLPATDADDDEDVDGDMLMELLASTSDMLLRFENRYIFIWDNEKNIGLR